MAVNKRANGNAGNGLNLFIVLFLIFLVLKLTNNTDWSWWWVTIPLWCIPAFLGGLSILFLAGSALVGLYRLIFWSKKKRSEHRKIRNVIKALEAYANSLSEHNS